MLLIYYDLNVRRMFYKLFFVNISIKMAVFLFSHLDYILNISTLKSPNIEMIYIKVDPQSMDKTKYKQIKQYIIKHFTTNLGMTLIQVEG